MNVSFVERTVWGRAKKRLAHQCFTKTNKVPRPPRFSLSRQIIWENITSKEDKNKKFCK
jgi:hypothetical protein